MASLPNQQSLVPPPRGPASASLSCPVQSSGETKECPSVASQVLYLAVEAAASFAVHELEAALSKLGLRVLHLGGEESGSDDSESDSESESR